MTIQYKETMSLILIIVLISLIIPFCMITSSRNTLVQTRVNDLIVARHEQDLVLDRAFNLPQPDKNRKSHNSEKIPDKERLTQEFLP
ncbi:MAG: hypothetical protein HQK75_16640 [Candidatus Magnetomorum sp.]|nr:hypothetical protein [Candidatus Magnetomorum sp.]